MTTSSPQPPTPDTPAWDTTRASLVVTNNHLIALFPYCPPLIKACKALMGRFGEVTYTQADGTRRGGRGWFLDPAHHAAVERLLATYFPAREALEQHIVTFATSERWGPRYDAPTIDGVDLLRFGRDARGRIAHDAVVEVLEDTLRTGGSAKNPTLSGTLKVRVRARLGAVYAWSGPATTVTVEDDPAWLAERAAAQAQAEEEAQARAALAQDAALLYGAGDTVGVTAQTTLNGITVATLATLLAQALAAQDAPDTLNAAALAEHVASAWLKPFEDDA